MDRGGIPAGPRSDPRSPPPTDSRTDGHAVADGSAGADRACLAWYVTSRGGRAVRGEHGGAVRWAALRCGQRKIVRRAAGLRCALDLDRGRPPASGCRIRRPPDIALPGPRGDGRWRDRGRGGASRGAFPPAADLCGTKGSGIAPTSRACAARSDGRFDLLRKHRSSSTYRCRHGDGVPSRTRAACSRPCRTTTGRPRRSSGLPSAPPARPLPDSMRTGRTPCLPPAAIGFAGLKLIGGDRRTVPRTLPSARASPGGGYGRKCR